MDAIVFARLYSLNTSLDHVFDDLHKLQQSGLVDSNAVQKFAAVAEEMRLSVKRATADRLLKEA